MNTMNTTNAMNTMNTTNTTNAMNTMNTMNTMNSHQLGPFAPVHHSGPHHPAPPHQLQSPPAPVPVIIIGGDSNQFLDIASQREIVSFVGLKGSIKPFGSYTSGLITKTSDLDVMYERHESERDLGSVEILRKFVDNLAKLGSKMAPRFIEKVKLHENYMKIGTDFCAFRCGLRKILDFFCGFYISRQ